MFSLLHHGQKQSMIQFAKKHLQASVFASLHYTTGNSFRLNFLLCKKNNLLPNIDKSYAEAYNNSITHSYYVDMSYKISRYTI